MPLTENNHYVPQLYLKHFARPDGKVCCYRTLVSRSEIPSWKRHHVAGIGYQSHLYTRALADHDSDAIEQWLNREFEFPAEKSLRKAISDERLDKEDYRLLIRFVVAQMVRTPAYFLRSRLRWLEFVKNEFGKIPERLSDLQIEKNSTNNSGSLGHDLLLEHFPLKLSAEPLPDGKGMKFNTRISVGRGMWQFAMRHILMNTLPRMERHRWTILSAESDLPWFTSDDPVVCLNFRSVADYDFKGAWDVPKTTIFMPLSPRHLFFTEVGNNNFQRGDILARSVAIALRKMVAEHAHRYIYSHSDDQQIEHYRPRVVHPEEFHLDQDFWNSWHKDESAEEHSLQSRSSFQSRSS
jgi:hypothetical protein